MNIMRETKPLLRVVQEPGQRATPPTVPPTQAETIDDLLEQSRRSAVPIRKTFVQRPRGSADRAGPLATFVNMRDERGLDFYLFLHALASSAPWTCTYPSVTWARVMGLASSCEPASAKAGVSKVLKRLEDRRLITRDRAGRQTQITLLHEDGQGGDYTRPTKAADGVWLNLPYAYWRQGHHQQLSLAGKAMLLVGLSLSAEFVLPQERMPDWYGFSGDTAQRGYRELRQLGLLGERSKYERDHKSTTGWREVRHRYLLAPYDPKSRSAAAASGRRARAFGHRTDPEDQEDVIAT